eukprot:1322546-Amorphochlora_amoeboformis.AAC.1
MEVEGIGGGMGTACELRRNTRRVNTRRVNTRRVKSLPMGYGALVWMTHASARAQVGGLWSFLRDHLRDCVTASQLGIQVKNEE